MSTMNKIQIRQKSLAVFFQCDIKEIEHVKGEGCTYRYKDKIYSTLTRKECKWYHDFDPDDLMFKKGIKSPYLGTCDSEYGRYYISEIKIVDNQYITIDQREV